MRGLSQDNLSCFQVFRHAIMNALTTKDLGVIIMKQMHAPEDVEELYICHLTLFVSMS